jgi:uncharacterized ferredoxin-like protein
MARLNGSDAAREAVLEVAKMAAAAAFRAPQVTGRLKLKTEILTGEDLAPIVEFFEAIYPISPVMYFDYQSLSHFLKQGDPPPILLIGADMTRSELGWDCGACGFDSCAAFNAYSKENRSRAMLWGGPTCNWKLIDFGAACDFACAAVAAHRFDCRAMGTIGAAAAGVGYLPECSATIGIPIGPAGDLVYFSRSQNQKTTTRQMQYEWLTRTSPTHWQAFPGSTRPCTKLKQDWWQDMQYVKFESISAAEADFVTQTLAKVKAVSEKHTGRVADWYKHESQPDR